MFVTDVDGCFSPSCAQSELEQKFNAAFYEAQAHRTPSISSDDILETFDESFFANIDDDDDYLLDYLTYESDSACTFDYSEFFIPPPPPQESNLDLGDIISFSFDADFHLVEDLEEQPWQEDALTTAFLRDLPHDALTTQGVTTDAAFGHLIGTKPLNNNLPSETSTQTLLDYNHVVLTQNEALAFDDPLLSSTSAIFPARSKTTSESSDEDAECNNNNNMQCQWEDCYQVYANQTALVRHIEKCHVELKRGDEFTCYWYNCPRKTKPFNARYKLLIHMRVHSGEKPNKCPFQGCNKAFSRLENLKIHQRSHTGERPYLCQFANCTKSFSNSSDRAKHQRTHFDTKPYACQVFGCAKKYTDPSSLRKHVKNHTYEEQVALKKRGGERVADPVRAQQRKCKPQQLQRSREPSYYVGDSDHSYSASFFGQPISSYSVKMDLKNKISEKNRQSALRNVAL